MPKLVKAFVNKRHQYFGLEPMHTSYEYSLSRIKQEPSKIGIKGTFNLFTASHWCTYSVLQLGHFGFAPEQTYPARAIWKSCCYSIQELLIDFIFIQ